MTFDEWKAEVDKWLSSHYEIVSDDLPDVDYHTLFDVGASPSAAAKLALLWCKGIV